MALPAEPPPPAQNPAQPDARWVLHTYRGKAIKGRRLAAATLARMKRAYIEPNGRIRVIRRDRGEVAGATAGADLGAGRGLALRAGAGQPALHVLHEPGRRLLGRLRLRLERQLGGERLLVRVGDPGESLDLARAGALVEALHVAALALVDRGAHVHLHEALAHSSAGLVAGGAVGGDGRHECHHAVA